MKIPKSLQKIYLILEAAGYECYIVGGAVRNYICGIDKTCDFDLTTNARPKDIIKLFKRVIPTGIKHGTVTILMDYDTFEITTYRFEELYTDSRHPEKISFLNGIHEDLQRRDFTINSLAYEPKTHQIIDLSDGVNDIHNQVIRAIGNPLKRFFEDGLRSLRAIRFVSQLGFSIEPLTYQAIQQSLHITQKVSKERIVSELLRILQGKKAVKACILLFHSKLLKTLFPTVNYSFLMIESIDMQYKFLRLFFYVFNKISDKDIELRMAVAFCFSEFTSIENIKNYHFLNITEKRLKTFLDIAKSYNFSLKFTKLTAYFITWSECPYDFSSWTDVMIRKYLQNLDLSLINETIYLWKLFCFKNFYECQRISRIKERIEEVLTHPQLALSIKKLTINGDDIIKNCNIREGKQVGIILNKLLNDVIEKPSLNKKETLILLAQKINNFIDSDEIAK